jgi:hypothetical protein
MWLKNVTLLTLTYIKYIHFNAFHNVVVCDRKDSHVVHDNISESESDIK